MKFDERSAEKIFGDAKMATIILMYAEGCPLSTKARSALKEISEKVKGHLMLSESTIDKDLG
jgi:ribosomal protein L31E